MDNLVLIYIAKKDCPACLRFDTTWRDLVDYHGDDIQCVRFPCTPDFPAPPCVGIYVEYYPTLILTTQGSYSKHFVDDKPTDKSGVVDAIKMSLDSVPSFENVKDWITENKDGVVRLNRKNV